MAANLHATASAGFGGPGVVGFGTGVGRTVSLMIELSMIFIHEYQKQQQDAFLEGFVQLNLLLTNIKIKLYSL